MLITGAPGGFSEQRDPVTPKCSYVYKISLQWRHNELAGVSNHQPHDCLLNRLSRRRSKKTSKLRVTGLCVGNSPGIADFPTQRASNAENVSIWWRHPVFYIFNCRLDAMADVTEGDNAKAMDVIKRVVNETAEAAIGGLLKQGTSPLTSHSVALNAAVQIRSRTYPPKVQLLKVTLFAMLAHTVVS